MTRAESLAAVRSTDGPNGTRACAGSQHSAAQRPATWAHSAVHSTSQHSGTMPQTHSAIGAESQPGSPVAAQHDPPGMSAQLPPHAALSIPTQS